MAQNRNHRHHRAPRRERYVSPKTKIIIALSAIAVIAVAVLVMAFVNGWIALPKLPERPQQTTPPTQPKEDTVIHLVAGGNVNITDKTVASGGSDYDYSNVFLDVLPELSQADLTLLNFEGNVYGPPYGTQHSSAPVQLLQALRASGVDILQTANTESLTNGLLGLAATNQAIRDAGMVPLGTYASNAEFEQYQGFVIYQIQGIRIALVAFTKGMDGRNLPSGSENCVNVLYEDYSSTYKSVNEEGITRVLKAVQAEKPDLTVAMLHWGGENTDQVSASQKRICRLMADLGVNAIIGTHSHLVQGMGFYEDTPMFVAYSLGDLVGDAEAIGTHYSALLELTVTKDGKTGKTSITGWDYTPVYQQYDENGALRLLRIRQAMAAYENDYIGKVSREVYDVLKSALANIEKRVKG